MHAEAPWGVQGEWWSNGPWDMHSEWDGNSKAAQLLFGKGGDTKAKAPTVYIRSRKSQKYTTGSVFNGNVPADLGVGPVYVIGVEADNGDEGALASGSGRVLLSNDPQARAEDAIGQRWNGYGTKESGYGMQAKAFIKAKDTNNDGVIDKDEWAAAGGTEEEFNQIDINGDGFVDEDELIALAAAMDQGGGGKGGKDGKGGKGGKDGKGGKGGKEGGKGQMGDGYGMQSDSWNSQGN